LLASLWSRFQPRGEQSARKEKTTAAGCTNSIRLVFKKEVKAVSIMNIAQLWKFSSTWAAHGSTFLVPGTI